MVDHAPPNIKIRILVIDDEKDITDMLIRHFRFQGFDITGVNSGAEALQLIESENFNIVITDIIMPGMNGLDLLEKIKLYNGAIQVIIITGYVTMHNIITAMQKGAETVLFKPFKDPDKLDTSVKRCIEKIEMWQGILKELGLLGKTGNV